MAREVGIRVGVIISGSKEKIELLGYGVYDGDLVHEELTQELREAAEEMDLPEDHPIFTQGHLNPHITLDDGGEVWGCECWWGPEEIVRKRVESAEAAGAKVVQVGIETDETSGKRYVKR